MTRKEQSMAYVGKVIEIKETIGDLPAGSKMYVEYADDFGQLHGKWLGIRSSLTVNPETDRFDLAGSWYARLYPGAAFTAVPKKIQDCAPRHYIFVGYGRGDGDTFPFHLKSLEDDTDTYVEESWFARFHIVFQS